MTLMLHKGCGGVIAENWSKTYTYVNADECLEQQPALYCLSCGVEILGDVAIEDLNI